MNASPEEVGLAIDGEIVVDEAALIPTGRRPLVVKNRAQRRAARFKSARQFDRYEEALQARRYPPTMTIPKGV